MTTLGSDPSSAGKSSSPPAGARPRQAQRRPHRTADTSGPGLERARHAELVHETRKAIKRMRAFARLQRVELGEWRFDRVDSSLRAAGRRLAHARDAEVRLATLEQLRERHPEVLDDDSVERLRKALRLEHEQTKPTAEQTVLEEIGEMRRELARWKLAEHDPTALQQGLRRIYREGRRHYRRVQRRGHADADTFHDWRKRVKNLYYALDMLGGTHVKGARASTRRAERLGDMLGEEHDLWVLTAYVREHPHLFEDAAARIALVALAEQQRERLRERALAQGARLYRRKPGAFARHMRKALTSS